MKTDKCCIKKKCRDGKRRFQIHVNHLMIHSTQLYRMPKKKMKKSKAAQRCKPATTEKQINFE